MKHMTKKIAGLSLGLALVLGCGVGTLSAAATSVGDVIAHAYAVGLPEAQIQQCIAQYSGGNYTSEQCDRQSLPWITGQASVTRRSRTN